MGAIVCIPRDDTISDRETLSNTRLNKEALKGRSSPFHEVDCDQDCIISLLAPVERSYYKKRKPSVEFHSCEDETKSLDQPSSRSTRIDVAGRLSPPPCSPESANQPAHLARSVQLDLKSSVESPYALSNQPIQQYENCNGNSKMKNEIIMMERRVKLQPLPGRIMLNVMGTRDGTCDAQCQDFGG
jgi:hypothetical protein